MQAVAPRKRKEKKKARSAARRGRRRENGIDKDLAILATVRRPPLGQAWSMNGTRHRRRSSVPIGRGWYHSGTTSTNRSLVSLLSLGRLRIKIQPGHLLFRLLFLLLPLSPLFFPRLFFLRFYLSTRCSSLLRCFVLFPSCTLFRALMIADETIRGGSVARVCFAVNWIGELRFECENVDPLHLKLARKIFVERSILRRNLSKWMLIFCWIYLIYSIKLGTFNGEALGVLIRQFFNF